MDFFLSQEQIEDMVAMAFFDDMRLSGQLDSKNLVESETLAAPTSNGLNPVCPDSSWRNMQSNNFDDPHSASPFRGHHSIFLEAELAELPNGDPLRSESIDLAKLCTVDKSCPLTVADYCVCSADIREGNLTIEEMTPEVQQTLLNSRAHGIKMIEELSTDVQHSTPNSSTQVVENRNGVMMIEEVTPELQYLLPNSHAHLLVNSIQV